MKKWEVINEITAIVAITVLDFAAVFASDKIRLSDIMVLTLYSGKMTNARRSGPIPQLKCTGGTAGCSSYVPQVVQCYNRGSDGYDVQWECKTDMDNAFRFGRVEISCEGYDYPDDPYVLRGSCGCEYTLDLTQEGYRQKKQKNRNHHHSYYEDEYGYNDNSYSYDGYSYGSYQKSSSTVGDIIMLVIIGLIIYAIYKTCMGNNQGNNDGYGYMDTDSDDMPSGGYRRSYFGGAGSPPPPGFRREYMPGGAGCDGTSPGTTGNTGGGFWTGAATGGILGYLLGNSGRRYEGYGYSRPYSTWGSGWGSGGFGFGSGRTSFGGSGGSSASYSSGTRTASGFGGTRRR